MNRLWSEEEFVNNREFYFRSSSSVKKCESESDDKRGKLMKFYSRSGRTLKSSSTQLVRGKVTRSVIFFSESRSTRFCTLMNFVPFSRHSIVQIEVYLPSDYSHSWHSAFFPVSHLTRRAKIFLDRLHRYVGAFSFALAFFNAVPCYALDGQYILSSFVEYLSPSLFKRRRASILLGLIFGTCLLIINVSLAFARYFLWTLSIRACRLCSSFVLKIKSVRSAWIVALRTRLIWLEETLTRISSSTSNANISSGNEGKLEMWRALCDMHIQQDIAIEISNCSWWVSFTFLRLHLLHSRFISAFLLFSVSDGRVSERREARKTCSWRWLKNKKQAGYEQFIVVIIKCNQASNCFFVERHYRHHTRLSCCCPLCVVLNYSQTSMLLKI